MHPYSGTPHKPSGVVAYEIREHSIRVRFRNGKTYTYSERNAGAAVVEQMKSLARANRGLSSFIARNNPVYD